MVNSYAETLLLPILLTFLLHVQGTFLLNGKCVYVWSYINDSDCLVSYSRLKMYFATTLDTPKSTQQIETFFQTLK